MLMRTSVPPGRHQDRSRPDSCGSYRQVSSQARSQTSCHAQLTILVVIGAPEPPDVRQDPASAHTSVKRMSGHSVLSAWHVICAVTATCGRQQARAPLMAPRSQDRYSSECLTICPRLTILKHVLNDAAAGAGSPVY